MTRAAKGAWKVPSSAPVYLRDVHLWDVPRTTHAREQQEAHLRAPASRRLHEVRKSSWKTYSTRNQEPVWGALGNNFAGFGPIAVPTRDFPGSSLYFTHNRNSFF